MSRNALAGLNSAFAAASRLRMTIGTRAMTVLDLGQAETTLEPFGTTSGVIRTTSVLMICQRSRLENLRGWTVLSEWQIYNKRLE